MQIFARDHGFTAEQLSSATRKSWMVTPEICEKRSISFAACCPELAGRERPLDGDPVLPGNHPGLTANGSRPLEDECRLVDHGCPVVNNGCRRTDKGWRHLDNG